MGMWALRPGTGSSLGHTVVGRVAYRAKRCNSCPECQLEGPALPELLQGYQRSQKVKQKELMMRSMRKDATIQQTLQLTTIQQTQLSWSWNKQIHSAWHRLCGLLPLLGKTWPEKKKIITTQSSNKPCTPRVHRQTGPLLPGSGWRGQGATPLRCSSQTGCVLATGAPGGEASCDLQTHAQQSTAPARADSSNTVFSLLGAASKHHPDHPPPQTTRVVQWCNRRGSRE